MRITDFGAVCGKDDIAEQSQSRPKTGGVAVHLRDDRLFTIQQGEDDLPGFASCLIPVAPIIDHGLHPRDVATRAEGAPSAGEDDNVGIGVQGTINEHPGELLMQCAVDGVEGLRTIELHCKNTTFALEIQMSIAAKI